jgi:3-phenylpropionate/trans-cinnamate dioxygenase ferredoxin subunit
MPKWIEAVPLASIEDEDVVGFDHGGKTFAIVRIDEQVYVLDGLCTHEAAHLADGMVMDYLIECPMHNGRFDVRDGRAVRPPACIDLRTYPAKIENGMVWIEAE